MRRIVAILAGLILAAQGTAGWAASAQSESTGEQIGYGVGSVVGSAMYFPFKASFCILGGIGSGFALVFAGPKTAEKTVSTACRGTWAITPDVVKGKETVRFLGDAPPAAPAPEPRPQR